ncbi:hypothetical protein BJ138DRAFT_1012174, partial [Hygrophoropsis aurantiaca]
SSTHNTRIERLWVEVGRQFARRWKGFFIHLERLHGLDRKNPHHLWLLHVLFLDLINTDCDIFKDEWNHHPVSGPTTQNQSPSDMRFLAQVNEGIYVNDPFKDIHPDILTRYHGTGGPSLSLEEQEDAEEMQCLEGEIAADLESNLNHEPIAVPEQRNPFPSAEIEALFHQALADVQAEGHLPGTLAFPTSEWDLKSYPTHEDITVGFRRAKTLTVPLPPNVWMPRAIIWAQALQVLEHFLL